MKKVCILYNTSKDDAINFYYIAKKFFEKHNIEVVSRVKDSSFVVVIGGDGTLLKASKEVIKYDKFAVAVNMGSLGFLTDIRKNEALEVFYEILNNDYKLEERYMFEITINNSKYLALNEVVLSKSGVTQNLIRIKVEGENYINTYRSDGLIVSTPTGSTGYSLSAGGPIIKPNLNVTLITPIAPHNLSTRPIIVDGNEEIILQLEEHEQDGYISIDGDVIIKVTRENKIYIKHFEKKLKLVIPKSRNYYSLLREKLKWGDQIC